MSPPHLSEGDTKLKSKLSSVTKRTSEGTHRVSPGPRGVRGVTQGTRCWHCHTLLLGHRLGPRHRGCLAARGGDPRPSRVPDPRWAARVAPAAAWGQSGLCGTGDSTAGADTARPGGAELGEPPTPHPGHPQPHTATPEGPQSPRGSQSHTPILGGSQPHTRGGSRSPGSPAPTGDPSPAARPRGGPSPAPGIPIPHARGVPAAHPDPGRSHSRPRGTSQPPTAWSLLPAPTAGSRSPPPPLPVGPAPLPVPPPAPLTAHRPRLPLSRARAEEGAWLREGGVASFEFPLPLRHNSGAPARRADWLSSLPPPRQQPSLIGRRRKGACPRKCAGTGTFPAPPAAAGAAPGARAGAATAAAWPPSRPTPGSRPPSPWRPRKGRGLSPRYRQRVAPPAPSARAPSPVPETPRSLPPSPPVTGQSPVSVSPSPPVPDSPQFSWLLGDSQYLPVLESPWCPLGVRYPQSPGTGQSTLSPGTSQSSLSPQHWSVLFVPQVPVSSRYWTIPIILPVLKSPRLPPRYRAASSFLPPGPGQPPSPPCSPSPASPVCPRVWSEPLWGHHGVTHPPVLVGAGWARWCWSCTGNTPPAPARTLPSSAAAATTTAPSSTVSSRTSWCRGGTPLALVRHPPITVSPPVLGDQLIPLVPSPGRGGASIYGKQFEDELHPELKFTGE